MSSLIKYRKPFEYLESLHNELNRLMEENFPEFTPSRGTEYSWTPLVELADKKDKFMLKAQLPGVDKDDIDIQINENSVTIKAEHECRKEEKDVNFIKSELAYGKYFRTINLPSKIDTQGSSATFKNGELHLELNKLHAEEQAVKKLEIKED